MIISKNIFFAFLFFFFATYSFWGFDFTYVASAGKIDLESFKDIDEIPLTITRPPLGLYGIYVWMYPHYDHSVREIESPMNLEFDIVMQQGKKTIEKKITKVIDRGFLGFTDWIFHVPRDFRLNGAMDILITNITLDDSARDYYQAIAIAVVCR